MKEIKLTQGKVAIVDDEDYETVNAHKWCAFSAWNTFYITRCVPLPNGTTTSERMHRVILARKLGRPLLRDEYTDHVNGDGLDNRRQNLRLATNAQNQRNCHRRKANPTSRFLGVYWAARDKRWAARIQVNRRGVNLGYYTTEFDAVLAREEYIVAHPELMARSNFPMGEAP